MSSSYSSSSGCQSGSLRWPAAGLPRLISRAAVALLSTRVANATSLVRRTASRLLTNMGTSTNSQSTTSDNHNNDCGMLGMVTRSFPRQT